jgi:hypothetical protein
VPCGSTAGNLNPFNLFAQSVTIPIAITVTSLGVFGNQLAGGMHTAMALYGDASGAPSNIIAATTSLPIVDGANEIPVTFPVAVAAGTYWIAGEYSAAASICYDDSVTNLLDIVSISSYGSLPDPFLNADGVSLPRCRGQSSTPLLVSTSTSIQIRSGSRSRLSSATG